MSSFTSALIVSPMPDGRKWKLVRSFTYHQGSEYGQDFVHVPAGFITDFASSPRFLWCFIPPFGRFTKAAVLHDYLYQKRKMVWGIGGTPIVHTTVTRKEADDIFHEAMLVAGTPEWKAKLMYWGVRLFGWLAWH